MGYEIGVLSAELIDNIIIQDSLFYMNSAKNNYGVLTFSLVGNITFFKNNFTKNSATISYGIGLI